MIRTAYTIIVMLFFSSYGFTEEKSKVDDGIYYLNDKGNSQFYTSHAGTLYGNSLTKWMPGVPPQPAVRCKHGHFVSPISYDLNWQDANHHFHTTTTYVCPVCLFDALQKLAADPSTTTNSVLK